MKLTLKIFIWKIQIKTTKLGAEEKVKFLANELIKSVQDCGHSIQNASISKKFGSIDINLQEYGTKDAAVYVENLLNDWEIKTEPNFKLLEVKK